MLVLLRVPALAVAIAMSATALVVILPLSMVL